MEPHSGHQLYGVIVRFERTTRYSATTVVLMDRPLEAGDDTGE